MTALRSWRHPGGEDAAPEVTPAPPPREPPDDRPDGAGGDAPATETRPPPRSLGAYLRGRRRERSQTLEEVEAATRINHAYLEAIESDRFELLPAPVYARGFVRLYARYLDLDPEETLTRLPTDLPRPPGLEPLPGLRRHEGARALPAVERRWLLLAGAAAAVLILVVFLGVPGFGGGGQEADAPDDGQPAAESTPVIAAGAEPAATVPPFDEGRAPDFSGVARAEAERVLQELGISFVVIEVASNEAPAGYVFAQTPEPGASLDTGDDVTLIVALTPEGSQ